MTLDRLDGVTFSADEWWFNVRSSNTEPLLRLNVEGVTRDVMERVRDEVVELMRRTTGTWIRCSSRSWYAPTARDP